MSQQNDESLRQEFECLLGAYNMASAKLSLAKCGSQCSPYKADKVPAARMGDLKLGFYKSAAALRRHPLYPGYVEQVNQRRARARAPYTAEIDHVFSCMDALLSALRALPKEALALNALPLRDGLQKLRRDMSAKPCEAADNHVARLTSFERKLESAEKSHAKENYAKENGSGLDAA